MSGRRKASRVMDILGFIGPGPLSLSYSHWQTKVAGTHRWGDPAVSVCLLFFVSHYIPVAYSTLPA